MKHALKLWAIIAVGAIATEHIDLVPPLHRLEIIDRRPHDLPEGLDVAIQRFGFGQRWLEMPSVIKVLGGSRTASIALAMKVRRLDAEPLTYLR